ncbi:class I SAM-dependent methyltransferase [Schlesneria sp.]|uniref:class I SAM-dependent methyltransferase n=1 Tax=Schlesneria sp. TaxID=2762018 RepID=UPI002EF9E9BD
MKSRRSSIHLCCFFCAVLSIVLLIVLSRGAFLSQASAQESPAKQDSAETSSKAKGRYQTRRIHDPNGTGKFYMGREIAQVMSFHGAPWLERPEREEEERLSELVRQLKLQPGQVVADIGAGSGVITMKMAEEVGPTGKVFAVDIQQEMLDLLGDKLQDRKIENIELVLGTDKSPKLEPNSIDLALMVDVYHELEFPFEMLLELSSALKPGGRIALVEYRREDPEVPIKLVHKMTEAQVKKEIGQPEFGLKWKETIGTLPRQHLIVFQKPAK